MNAEDSLPLPSPPITIDGLPSRSLFEAQAPERLFHYTDLDGVAGVLRSRSLWLSKISTLNDTSEISLAVLHFKDLAHHAARDFDRETAEFLVEAAAQLDNFRRTNICVASFCEDEDHLGQWRSYANDGRGIALGFDTAVLREIARAHDVRLVRCIYEPELHERIGRDLVAVLVAAYRAARPKSDAQRLDLLNAFNSTFLLSAPVIKDRHFAQEKEWRLVSMPRSVDDTLLTAILTGNLASVRFVLPLCPEHATACGIISSVTVGPTLDPENVADAVDVLARRQGFRIPAFRFSQVPYRPKHP